MGVEVPNRLASALKAGCRCRTFPVLPLPSFAVVYAWPLRNQHNSELGYCLGEEITVLNCGHKLAKSLVWAERWL